MLMETHVCLDSVEDGNLLYSVMHFGDVISFTLASGQAFQDAESATETSVRVCQGVLLTLTTLAEGKGR